MFCINMVSSIVYRNIHIKMHHIYIFTWNIILWQEKKDNEYKYLVSISEKYFKNTEELKKKEFIKKRKRIIKTLYVKTF